MIYFKALKGKSLQPRILYLVRLSCRTQELKNFSDKQKIKRIQQYQTYPQRREKIKLSLLADDMSAKELMLSNCGAGEDLRVPWTARRSNQSVLKEINPEYSLEGLML